MAAVPGDRGEASVDVADRARIDVPRGGRVLVVSDLHLVAAATTGSQRATDAIADAVERWDGPGAIVLAGDCFELLGEPHLDPGLALDAHPRFTAALAGFSGPDRHVVVLPGNHDGHLAWHAPAAATVRARLGAVMALGVDIDLACGVGVRRLRVEHGHQLDPANAFVDPRDPAETPLGHHIVQDLLPQIDGLTHRPWGQGLGLLADPLDLPAVLGSRLVYRQIGPVVAAAAVPLLAALVLGLAAGLGAPTAGIALGALAVAVLLAVAIVGGALVWGGVGWRAFRGWQPDMTGGGDPGNEAAHRRAAALAEEGVAAYVTGHTHIPELAERGGILYANPGCGGGLLHRRPGRLGLPDAHVVVRHVSWVELDAAEDLLARLSWGHAPAPGITRLERWATRPATPAPVDPTVVATLAAPPVDARTSAGSPRG
jgi:predicted phosphodiesterase